MSKYTPDSRLDGISRIPTDFTKRNMLPDAKSSLGYPWTRIPPLSTKKTLIGKRILAVSILSTSFGFAAAWFGATTFDHINLKIDSFRDRMDVVPYK